MLLRLDGGGGLAEDLAREAEIDRASGRGGGDFEGAGDDVVDLVGTAELVVPLDHFAQHAGLVEHLLRPVDVDVAGARGAGLGDGSAAGGEQEGDVVAGGVDQGVDGVGGADVGVGHDGLGAAGDGGVAVGHGDGGVFVGHDHGAWDGAVGAGGAGVGLDDRGEVGTRVGEEVVDALGGEGVQVVFGGDAGGHGWMVARGGGEGKLGSAARQVGHRQSVPWAAGTTGGSEAHQQGTSSDCAQQLNGRPHFGQVFCWGAVISSLRSGGRRSRSHR